MATWALSGIVMMYVAFPDLTEAERIAGLPPFVTEDCCAAPDDPIRRPLRRFDVYMRGLLPSYRAVTDKNEALYFNARTGVRHTEAVGATEAAAIAQSFHDWSGGVGSIRSIESIDIDQWTVYDGFRKDRPIHRVGFDDQARTILYVSSTSGEVIQDTRARERFWNWLGAVPHWTYFTFIRRHSGVWTNFIICASLLGTIVSITGFYFGLHEAGRGKGLNSPYKGASKYHHWLGLIFGAATVIWIFSGLASMQPWGLFTGVSAAPDLERLEGGLIESGDVAAFTAAVSRAPSGSFVEARLFMQGGRPVGALTDRNGATIRVNPADLSPMPLSNDDWRLIATRTKPDAEVEDIRLLTEPDGFYFSHGEDVAPFPVYRVITNDPERTRYYFSPETGELRRKVDRGEREYRIFFEALHRFDFHGAIRARPVRDLVMLPLMTGISALCLLACWIGVRRLCRIAARGRMRAHWSPS